MIDLDAWLTANNPTEAAKWTLTEAGARHDAHPKLPPAPA